MRWVVCPSPEKFAPHISQIEMAQWWCHYSGKFPSGVSVDDKAKVEFTTGCVPLFLDKFLSFPGKTFSEIEKSDAYLSNFRFLVRNEILGKLGNPEGVTTKKLQTYVRPVTSDELTSHILYSPLGSSIL